MANSSTNKHYESILVSIASNVAGRVDGVASLAGEPGLFFRKYRKKNSGIQLFIENNSVIMDIYIYAFSEYNIPDVAFNIQQGVKKEIESVTMFKVKAINVKVVGVVFPSGI